MNILGLDHVVLTVRDLEATIDFYGRALGMRAVSFARGKRRALAFGDQKINLHLLGAEFMPNARVAGPGTADLCFLTDTPLEQAVARLESEGVDIEHGAGGCRRRTRAASLGLVPRPGRESRGGRKPRRG